MRTISGAESSALAQRSVALRDLVWITAKDRTTGSAQSVGFWNDVGTVTLSVIDPLTGASVARTFVGAGSLLGIDDIAASADLSIKQITVRLSGVNATVAQAVRGYDPRLAPIQIHRLIINPASGAPYAAARARFVGFVERVDIIDPPPGGQGLVTVTAVSQLRELTRANPDMTSSESQKLRLGTDRFLEFANDVSKWRIMWGALSVKAGKKNKKNKDGGKGGKDK